MRQLVRPLFLAAMVLVVVGLVLAVVGGSRVAVSITLVLAILFALAVLRAGGGPGRY